MMRFSYVGEVVKISEHRNGGLLVLVKDHSDNRCYQWHWDSKDPFPAREQEIIGFGADHDYYAIFSYVVVLKNLYMVYNEAYDGHPPWA